MIIVANLISLLDQYEEKLVLRPLAARTLRLYKSRLRNFLQFLHQCEESMVDAEQLLADYAQWMRNDLLFKDSTINLSLRTAENFLISAGAPVKRSVKKKSVSRSFSCLQKAQEKLIIAELARRRSSKLAAIFFLFLRTGIRMDELVRLNREDVFITGGSLVVRISGSRQRTVPLPDDANRALSGWLRERAGQFCTEALFVNRSGSRISPSGIDFCLKALGHRVHLELCATTLRRTFYSERIQTSQVADSAHIVPACYHSFA